VKFVDVIMVYQVVLTVSGIQSAPRLSFLFQMCRHYSHANLWTTVFTSRVSLRQLSDWHYMLTSMTFQPLNDLHSSGNWTTCRYTKSRTGHLTDWSTRTLDDSRTSQLADWTSCRLDNSRMPPAVVLGVLIAW